MTPEAQRRENERRATAAFKLRLAMPGILGEELTVKIQSLRVLPTDLYMGREDVGALVALPGAVATAS